MYFDGRMPSTQRATTGLPEASPLGYRALTAVVVGGMAFLFTWLGSPLQDEWPPLLVINVAVGILFVFAAALLIRDGAQRGTAVLLSLAGLAWFTGWIRVPLPGPLSFMASTVGALFWAFAGWALLRYPESRLADRAETLFMVSAVLWLGAGHTLCSLFFDPTWDPARWPSGTWWPTMEDDRGIYTNIRAFELIVDAVLVAAYLLLAVRRLRRLGGVDRWVLAPLVASIVAAGAPLVLRVAAPLSDQWLHTLAVVTSAAVLIVPLAFLAAIVRTRMTHTAVADVVMDLSKPDPADVTTALRRALRDPTLELRFWIPATKSYVDEAGQPVTDQNAQRLIVPIDDPSAGRIGVVVADPQLARHQHLVDAAVGASGLALRNAKLQAELRAQLDQLQASRRRITEAGVAERRRIERDLHDGLQQRLLALTLTVAELRSTTVDSSVLSGLETIRSEMHSALQELRDVAHGVMPAMLAQGGLRPALDDVVDRLPLGVELEVESHRYPAAVELTTYYIACEGLANIVKHAHATLAKVRITSSDTELHLEVVDNGRGGADVASGTGLAGLADRARALGGDLSVIPGPAGGTTLRAVLPCG